MKAFNQRFCKLHIWICSRCSLIMMVVITNLGQSTSNLHCIVWSQIMPVLDYTDWWLIIYNDRTTGIRWYLMPSTWQLDCSGDESDPFDATRLSLWASLFLRSLMQELCLDICCRVQQSVAECSGKVDKNSDRGCDDHMTAASDNSIEK